MTPDLTHSILMQYQTPLPDNTEMAPVRKRVADLAPVFDRYPGLYFKLMVVNDLGSAPINEYSSIYLWRDLQSMTGFLTGDWFHSYSSAFVRPPVRWWLPHSFAGNLESLARAHFVRRQTVGIPRISNVGEFIQEWKNRIEKEAALIQIIAFDPVQWELVTLDVWENQPTFQWKSEFYSVEHISLPNGTPHGAGNNG
jgi:Domain of unknown function (DUF4865)